MENNWKSIIRALPKPYYKDKYVQLYNADAIAIMRTLPDDSINLILTDPPYGLNYNEGDLAGHLAEVKGRMPRPVANDGEDEANLLFRRMLRQACRVLTSNGGCCCCCGGGGPKPLFARWVLWMDKYLHFKQAVVWDKDSLGLGLHYRRSYEFLLIATKTQKCVWNGGRIMSNVWKLRRIIPKDTQHPTEKPVALMGRAIELHSNPGHIVLDPFSGHGSTLVAAKQLGRRAIGVEMDESYCDVIANKLWKTQVSFLGS